MNLFDDIISTVQALTTTSKSLCIHESKIEDAKNQNMVFQSDTAFELIGNSITLPSSDILLKDGIYLIGKDLNEINQDTQFCRIVLVQIKETEKKAQDLFNLLKALDFTKYHVSPKGFMMRVSSMKEKESIRVSKKGLHNGLNFEEVGNHFLKAYHIHSNVIAVEVIFITDESFDYNSLHQLSKKVKDRTNLIDHMTKDMTMNCNTCHEKVICDAVDGMKELHEQSRN